MDNIINLGVGEMAVGKEDSLIRTDGIGSCLVICLYDKESKIGGLAHCMLPRRHGVASIEDNKSQPENAAKYVEDSIPLLLKKVEKIGGKKDKIRAKIVGGSEMFKILKNEKGIGEKNIEIAKQVLKDLGVIIESEDTGGNIGRIAELNLSNGVLSVSAKL